jgi:hypothetical protein
MFVSWVCCVLCSYQRVLGLILPCWCACVCVCEFVCVCLCVCVCALETSIRGGL